MHRLILHSSVLLFHGASTNTDALIFFQLAGGTWGNKRPWNRARKVDGTCSGTGASERRLWAGGEWVAGGEGWAPSDGHGHDRGGYGRPGRDIELVAREDGQRASIRLLQKRTLSLPTPPHALPPPVLPPAPPPRGAPTSLPSRALSPLPGEPRETESSERERERKDEKELAEGGGWVAGSTGLQPRDTTGQRDTLVYSISPSRVHTRFPRAIIRAATR